MSGCDKPGKREVIAIASDHAGFRMKEEIKKHLIDLGLEVVDLGTFSEEPVDYPDLALKLALGVSSGRFSRGILLCGTGIGMCIAANKVRGIRAALCWNEKVAELSRRHNNSNVLCLGARFIDLREALRIAETWLKTDFDGGRHLRRIEKISRIEELLSRGGSPS